MIESCRKCGSRKWFVETRWSAESKRAELRIVCQDCGNSSSWVMSYDDNATIDKWNQEQNTVRSVQ